MKIENSNDTVPFKVYNDHRIRFQPFGERTLLKYPQLFGSFTFATSVKKTQDKVESNLS